VAIIVALTGFMGSGKSAVGASLADMLGWEFVDLDTKFEESTGRTIAEFFEKDGEEAFRAKEAGLLRAVLQGGRGSDLVLALGGGTLERPDSFKRVREECVVVLLDADPDDAWARVSHSGRPLVSNREMFYGLWEKRQPVYMKAAQWVLPVRGYSAEDIAGQLLDVIDTDGGIWTGLWGSRLAGKTRTSLIVGGVGVLEFLAMRAAQARRQGSAFHVVSDENVMDAWGDRLLPVMGVGQRDDVYVMRPGEASKSVTVLESCWDWLAARRARRGDTLVAFGGGVVGDLGGFAAATYNRGMSLWQVPTTLVAQVDSSVGGKTAVNLKVGKNLVGAFYQPDLVAIDPSTLTTLPGAEYIGGLGEVVKHALLDSESALEFLETHTDEICARQDTTMSELVRRNVFLKAAVVGDDESETGRRAILNLGHTTAHALEVSLGYGAISHGPAVALGLLVALAVSERSLGLDSHVRGRVAALFRRFGIDTVAGLPSAADLLGAASHDKKVSHGSSGFVGLRAIGDAVWGLDVATDTLAEALEVIRQHG
jgi:shikimate kinase/3-dehydroquinate synthase